MVASFTMLKNKTQARPQAVKGGKRKSKSIEVDGVQHNLAGFERWDDVLQVRYPDATHPPTTIPPDHPRWILIYGWGDALPKHINKYCDKYQELFPHAAQVLVTCGISKAGYEPRIERRAQMVSRLVAEVFGGAKNEAIDGSNVLVHCMSNMGGIFYASTLVAYERQFNRRMPHSLLVMDSTPGGTDYTLRNIMLWGGAAAMKISRNTKVPFVLANIYGSLLFVPARLRSYKARQDPPGAFSRKAMNDPDHIDPTKTRFLYIYGNDDSLIHAEDIEKHIAESQERGWDVDVELFDGTQHVGHMKKYPERYWDAISESWRKAVSQLPETPMDSLLEL